MQSRRVVLLATLLCPAGASAQQRRGGAVKPEPLSAKQPAAPPPPKNAIFGRDPRITASREAAPVPNRLLEGPVVVAPSERATLEPSIIHRRLPGRGQAADGSPSRTEERLFDPAPGARLTVPFTY